MSSLTRRMQRRKARSKAAAERPAPRPQTLIMGDEPYTGTNPRIRKMFARSLVDGYVTVRYTRGPLRVSALRIAVQGAIENMHEGNRMRVAVARASRPARVVKSDRPAWRKSIWPAAKVARRAQAVA